MSCVFITNNQTRMEERRVEEREQTMAANDNRWSDLHGDLLVEIARWVKWYEDFVSFGGVCTSWRFAAVSENFMYKSSQVPWLVFPPAPAKEDDQDQDQEHIKDQSIFFSLTQGMIRRVTLPDFDSARYLPSRGGWLIKLAPDLSFMFHPFSRVQLQLPHMDTIPDWDVENTTTFAFCMSKCAVSDSQQVVIIYGGTAKLARAKPGDEAWTKVNNTEHSSFGDVICNRDQFYAINGDTEIFAIDGDVARSASAPLPDGLRRQKQECLYLVGSEDSDRKLWVVSREGVDLRPVHPGNEDVLHYGTYGFQVFEVYLGTKRWKEIENLANRSIFLGHNSSLSLDVSSKPRCKTNCIYFTDDYGEGYWYMHEEEHTEFGGKDMGIYNLQDGTVEPLYKGQYSYHPINFAKTSEVLAVVKLQERLISACLL